jgi:hypothetical protein
VETRALGVPAVGLGYVTPTKASRRASTTYGPTRSCPGAALPLVRPRRPSRQWNASRGSPIGFATSPSSEPPSGSAAWNQPQ